MGSLRHKSDGYLQVIEAEIQSFIYIHLTLSLIPQWMLLKDKTHLTVSIKICYLFYEGRCNLI